MIELEEALRKILENTPLLSGELRPLADSLGYVLAGEVRTREPVPAFDASAMDGFAVRIERGPGSEGEEPAVLSIRGEIRPGAHPVPVLSRGCTFRVFTGSPVPGNTGAVVMKEHVEDLGSRIRIKVPVRKGENVRLRGGEFQEGEMVFSPGVLVTPSVMGMLASLGCMEVEVARKPLVAVVLTGDEVQPPEAVLRPGSIRDANSHSLAAALQAMGIPAPLILHARDDEEETRSCLSRALDHGDVVLTVGGVSVGEYDFVKSGLERLGVETVFWRVAMKPGKPNYFGKKNGKQVFGLPGNAVSALVSFYLLVRPALRKAQGSAEPRGTLLKARLEADLHKKDDRLEWVRGRLIRSPEGETSVQPLPGQDSHMLGNMAHADCLIRFPRDRDHLPRGAFVDVELLRWNDL